MDSFGKAFKAGLAKAYAAGQQQVQNKVSKLLNQDKSDDYKPPDHSAYGWQYGAGTHPGQQPPYDHVNSYPAPAAHQNTLYFPPPPNQAVGHPADAISYPPAATGPRHSTAGVPNERTYESCAIPSPYTRPSGPQHSLHVIGPQREHVGSRPSVSAAHALTPNLTTEAHSDTLSAPPSTAYRPQSPYGSSFQMAGQDTATRDSLLPREPHSSSYPRTSPGSCPLAAPVPPSTYQQDSSAALAAAHQAPRGTHQCHDSHSDISDTALNPAPLAASRMTPSGSGTPSIHVPAPPTPPRRKPLSQNNGVSAVGNGGGKVHIDTVHSPSAAQTMTGPSGPSKLSEQTARFDVENRQQQEQKAEQKPVPASRRIELEPMKSSGETNVTVRFCPEGRAVDYELDWYHLEDTPSYLICTRCHAHHIRDTPLAARFQRVTRSGKPPSTCGFFLPRVKDILWPRSLRTNTTDGLRAFMARRLEMPACRGRNAVTGAEGIKWFGMAAKEIEGFIACEACYENIVIGTAFELNFAPYRNQGAEEKWTCDLCIPYIARAVAPYAKRQDWAGFVEAAAKRLQLPACEGRAEEANLPTWFVARQEMAGFHACEACYLDKVSMTAFEHEFERHVRAPGFDAFLEMLGQRWTCSLTDSNLAMAFALEATLFRRDFGAFSDACRKMCSLIPCTANGIIRGNWWTLLGGCEGLSVCEACYEGIIRTNALEAFFETAQRDAKATMVCDFCAASPRFSHYMSRLVQSLDTGVFGHFSGYASKYAGVAACPGIEHREKARWWGYPEALFCQDCYIGFVADTPLGKSLVVNGEHDERAQICQIWSPRMRSMWTSACAAGPADSPERSAALDEFKAFAAKRLQVYLETVPRMRFIRGMKEMRMLNAMHQGHLGIMYSGMNNLAAVSGTTDGYLHGSSSLGWYETENGATGAQMLRNMQSGFADANRMDEWVQMAQLEAVWREVE